MIQNSKGRPFSIEARIVVALMRKLGVTKINMSELDLSDVDSLIIDNNKVEIYERTTKEV